jgi:hypothetical protein
MEAEKIILFYLTVPPALFILGILIVELDLYKLVKMVVITILALSVFALFEKLDDKYEKARKEI